MLERTQRRTYKWVLGFFFGFLFLQGVFAHPTSVLAEVSIDRLYPTPTDASIQNPNDPTTKATGTVNTNANQPSTDGGCDWKGFIASPLTCSAKSILVGIRDMMAWVASGAAALFVWVVDPANISGPTGMLNKTAVYNLWKFIRDFFNLFFIFILLFSAFATIFQLEAFSIRKIFLNILFAALIINFSFPITRFLIDITNVPMYYFINVTVEGTGSGALKVTESLLGASGIPGVMMNNGADFSILFMNIIFIFLFAISLLVLAVLMLIRVIALVLLLVFSPFGFAATLLPGMQDLGRRWWSKFWSYAFFGPAAALVLMVSVRFMNEIGKDGTFGSMIATSTQMSAGSFQSSALAQITFYTIPIILIWTAIGMANGFSIAGASKVTGMGYGAANWTKKKLGQGAKLAVSPITTRVQGAAAGAKEGLKGGKLFGAQVIPKSLTPKAFAKRSEEAEARWKGRFKDGTGANELAKLHSKHQYEAADEMKKNNVGNSALLEELKGGDKIRAAAAAMVLADRKAIKTTDDFSSALKALGSNTKEIATLIEKTSGGSVGSMDEVTYRGLMTNTALSSNTDLQKQLNTKIVTEGNAKILVDYELGGANAPANAQQIETAVKNVVKNNLKSAKDIAKQEALFNDANYQFWALNEIGNQVVNNPDRRQAIKKASSEEGTSVGAMI